LPAPYSKPYLEIRKLEHLSFRLGISLDELTEVADSVNRHYLFRKRRKKNGDFRTISAPKPRLKNIQGRIHGLLREVILDDAAHCGIKGRSNLSNARQHVNKEILLSLDFRKFFPSISHHRVYNMFLMLKCSPEVARLLTRISTVNGEVPQGGRMSTDIANLICRTIDKRISGLASKYNISYTRYCDDLSFSGQAIPESFIRKVKEIISKSGFKLNEEKETLSKKNSPQIVTGLSVNRSRPKIPKPILRKLRAELYIFNKYESCKLSETSLEKRQRQIQGKIAYRNYIEKKEGS
jgi:hypothetical protein